MSWRENIEHHLHLKAIIFLYQLVILKDRWKTLFRFYETKKETATNLFGNIINTHPFEDGNGRICRLTFDRKPSVLYTMIVKSLIHCWDNSEQNARMLAQC